MDIIFDVYLFKNFLYINLFTAHTFNLTAKELSLYSCNVKDIQPEAFGNIDQIDLGGNKLKTIKKHFFTSPFIKVLYLFHNDINHIENSAFTLLENLKLLDLRGNKLKSFHGSDVLGENSNLKILTLEENEIEDVSSFNNMPQLEVLNMSSNYLKVVDDNCFYQLSNLKVLDLSNNQIQRISETSIPFPNSLNYLFLHDNNMKFLTDLLLNRLSVIGNITLANNPWQCKCLEHIQDWMKIQNVMDLCGNDIMCENEEDECRFDVEKTIYGKNKNKKTCYSEYWRYILPDLSMLYF